MVMLNIDELEAVVKLFFSGYMWLINVRTMVEPTTNMTVIAMSQ